MKKKEENIFDDIENAKEEVEKIFGEKKENYYKPGEARFILMQKNKGEKR